MNLKRKAIKTRNQHNLCKEPEPGEKNLELDETLWKRTQ